jgi:hypothetical protein
MSILRVEQDGIEFFTESQTGACKMSEAGMARLCNITHQSMNQRIRYALAGKTASESLNQFAGKYLPQQVTLKFDGYPIVVNLYESDFCAAVIEYYAFESRHKTAEALFAYRKFAKMGIERWIQGITGWEPPMPAIELTEEAVIDFMSDRLEPGMIPVGIQTESLTEMLKRGDFNGSGCRLYFYLEMMHLQGKTPSEGQICKDLKIAPSTLRKWLPQIHDWSHCADWLQLQGRKGPEYMIQLRMHKALGGVMEAYTAAGRIDLVTAAEVIEIKKVADWKDAVGEVMAKGQFFPKHQKRIHLFGNAEKLRETITTICTALDITMTIEPALSIMAKPDPVGNSV